MAFSTNGAKTGSYTSTADPANLSVTSAVSAGETLVLLAGTDTTSRGVTSIYDSAGNTWEWVASSDVLGRAVIASCKVTLPLTTSDSISINWSGGSANTTARVYSFGGIKGTNVGQATRTGYSSAPFVTVNASEGGVMFVVFAHPQDYLIGEDLGSFTKLVEIDNGTTMSILGAYKTVNAGNNTCTDNIGVTINYQAAGIVLPYASAALLGRVVVVA